MLGQVNSIVKSIGHWDATEHDNFGGHNFSITRLVLVKKPASAAAASQIMIDYQVGILASEHQQLQIECKLDAFDKSYHTNWATLKREKFVISQKIFRNVHQSNIPKSLKRP